MIKQDLIDITEHGISCREIIEIGGARVLHRHPVKGETFKCRFCPDPVPEDPRILALRDVCYECSDDKKPVNIRVILGTGELSVKYRVTAREGDIEISEDKPAVGFKPGADLSAEHPKLTQVATAVWNERVIRDYHQPDIDQIEQEIESIKDERAMIERMGELARKRQDLEAAVARWAN